MRRLLPLLLLLGCPEAPSDDDPVDDTDLPEAETRAVLSAPRRALVGETVALDATASVNATSAQWDFGDDEGTEAGAPLATSHAWTRPGHYTVTVAVEGEGGTSTTTTPITVGHPLLDEAPRRSSSVVLGAGRAWAVLPDLDAVAVVDLDTFTVERHLEPCGSPRRLSWAPKGAGGVLAVACEERGAGVVVYDVTASGQTTERWRRDLGGTGLAPFGVVIGGDEEVYVAARTREDADGRLVVYRPNGDPDRNLRIGADLRGLAWRDDFVVITQFRSPDEGGAWWRFELGAELVHTESLAPSPGPDSDTNARGVPNLLSAVAVRPDGRTAVIAGLKSNMARGLQRDGQALTHETTVRSSLRHVSLDPEELLPGTELGWLRVDDRDLFSAVAYHPLGDWLYVASQGVGVVDVIDPWNLKLTRSLRDAGKAPDGLAVSDDGDTLYVAARWSRELVRYDLSGDDSTPDARLDLRGDLEEPLADDVLLGGQIFHDSADRRMSRDGYVSCASCHPDGEEDGRVWDFTDRQEGLRNTIGLRGYARRSGLPIHWSGNFDEVQDFEHDIRGPQQGDGFLDDADFTGSVATTLGDPKAGLSDDLDALAAYVESLVDVDVLPVGGLDVSEGQALFEDDALGCADCHPGGGSASAWLLDGTPRLVDVGTLTEASGSRLGGELTGLDIPDLHGAWATPPYLHDGSAASLRDVVTPCDDDGLPSGCNPDDLHGVTSQLSGAQLDALTDYLRSL